MELSNGISIDGKDIDRYYNKLDDYQKEYYNAILSPSKSVICVDAQAGTGKTTIAVMAALELLGENKINKIYYIRFADDRSLKLGYLPGNVDDKTSMYMTPFYDACLEFGLDMYHVDKMAANDSPSNNPSIILCTDIMMRGINIEKSMVIIDEGQNARFSDLKLVLTRLHDNCKCVLCGHSAQVDNYKGTYDFAFERYIEHMCKKPWAIQCHLPINYRGKISKWADELEPLDYVKER